MPKAERDRPLAVGRTTAVGASTGRRGGSQPGLRSGSSGVRPPCSRAGSHLRSRCGTTRATDHVEPRHNLQRLRRPAVVGHAPLQSPPPRRHRRPHHPDPRRIRRAADAFSHPLRLAEDIATVDVIWGGHFELGIGIGFKREEFTGFGVSSKERGARTDQSLDIIHRALSGETVTFKSEFSIFRTSRQRPSPSNSA